MRKSWLGVVNTRAIRVDVELSFWAVGVDFDTASFCVFVGPIAIIFWRKVRRDKYRRTL